MTASGQTTITWETPGTTKNQVAEVRLYYTVDGGLSWRLIGTQSGNTGRYDNWGPVATRTSANCKVRVVLEDANGVTMGNDKSDTTFTIMTP
ncbi:MAG: hypothetical protein FIA94_07025 [Nitrospirae bacterium]|nr:hypothetical protein [Nitrospirota bacterium]